MNNLLITLKTIEENFGLDETHPGEEMAIKITSKAICLCADDGQKFNILKTNLTSGQIVVIEKAVSEASSRGKELTFKIRGERMRPDKLDKIDEVEEDIFISKGPGFSEKIEEVKETEKPLQKAIEIMEKFGRNKPLIKSNVEYFSNIKILNQNEETGDKSPNIFNSTELNNTTSSSAAAATNELTRHLEKLEVENHRLRMENSNLMTKIEKEKISSASPSISEIEKFRADMSKRMDQFEKELNEKVSTNTNVSFNNSNYLDNNRVNMDFILKRDYKLTSKSKFDLFIDYLRSELRVMNLLHVIDQNSNYNQTLDESNINKL